MNIPVVYEDEWLMVVNKPSGLLTIPTPQKERRTLTSILNDDLKERNLTYRLHPCHRLDRETSGLIIYAKGKAMQKKMLSLFRNKKIKKSYLVFIQGHPVKDEGEVRHPVAGLAAVTKYRITQKRKDFSVVQAYPLTGRTNQLRIHFKGIGHPILGETKFAFRRDFKLKAKRLCLHAQSLEFIHPVTNEFMHLHADLPDELKELLQRNP